MIEITIRIYNDPHTPDGTDPLEESMPENFTGIAIAADFNKLSEKPEDAKIERTAIDYIMPRLHRVMNTIIQGKPVATVILSADAEDKLSDTIEEVLIRSALDAQMSNMMVAPMKGGHVQ